MHSFKARLKIISGNPYVNVPPPILNSLFQKASKDKGPIPIRGKINGKKYTQTLVKYSSEWRLYVNMKMLKDSPRRIGEEILVEVGYDSKDRSIEPHPHFIKALQGNSQAHQVFSELSPSRQQEILRYINNLKTEESVNRNVIRAVNFLTGKGSFVGRQKP